MRILFPAIVGLLTSFYSQAQETISDEELIGKLRPPFDVVGVYKEMAERATPTLAPELAKALGSENKRIRRYAGEALMKLAKSHPEVLASSLQTAVGSGHIKENDDLKRAAIILSFSPYDHTPVPALRTIHAKTEDPDVRVEVFQALANRYEDEPKGGSEEKGEELRKELKAFLKAEILSAKNRRVRRTAARAFSNQVDRMGYDHDRIQPEEIFGFYANILRTSSDEEMREDIATVMMNTTSFEGFDTVSKLFREELAKEGETGALRAMVDMHEYDFRSEVATLMSEFLERKGATQSPAYKNALKSLGSSLRTGWKDISLEDRKRGLSHLLDAMGSRDTDIRLLAQRRLNSIYDQHLKGKGLTAGCPTVYTLPLGSLAAAIEADRQLTRAGSDGAGSLTAVVVIHRLGELLGATRDTPRWSEEEIATVKLTLGVTGEGAASCPLPKSAQDERSKKPVSDATGSVAQSGKASARKVKSASDK